MATMTRVTATPIDASYSATTGGQAPGAITSPANGDLIPISSGRGTLIIAITSGTGATVILTNVTAPAWGSGGNVTLTLATTDIQCVLLGNDGVDRFDQGPPTNPGMVLVNYTTASALKVYAVTIP